MTKKKAPARNPQTLDSFDWLTVNHTAAYLQCSPRTVHRYIAEGKLKVSQIVARGKIRIPTESIKALIHGRTA